MLSGKLAHLYRSGPRLVNILRVLWVAAIVWFELGTFTYHVSQCAWPETLPAADHSVHHAAKPTHVLLVADPQVLDHRSYPGRAPWLMALSQRMVDLYLRKSWRAALRLRPDVVVFLGDMMDGGRHDMSDAEYESYYGRFRSIFAIGNDTPVHYIPGNHDVGIGGLPDFSDHAHERYMSHFGPLNQPLLLGNHTFVMVDAPGLVEEDARRVRSGLSFERWATTKPGGPIAFIQESAAVAKGQTSPSPTILLTHIPLARPEGASCGPLRERGTIRKGAGYGYENTLSAQASQLLLQSLRPEVVFSGDDHDYCEFRHPLAATDDIALSEDGTVKEISVKSFSMAMGIRRPGFQLLTLQDPSTVPAGSPTFGDVPCFLPDQLGIYLAIYVPLILASLLALLVSNGYRTLHGGAHTSWQSVPSRIPLRARTRSPTDEEQVNLWGSAPPPLPPTLHIVDELEDEEDADEGSPYALPPPTPAVAVTGKGRRARSWQSRIRSMRRRCATLLCRRRGTDGGLRRSRAGLLRGFAEDVLDVAWVPLVLFAAIAWWMFL